MSDAEADIGIALGVLAACAWALGRALLFVLAGR
jgi:hypothetical protein